MKFLYGCLLSLLGFSTGVFTWETAQPVQDCGSPLATLTKLEITPPCQKDVCVVKRGDRILVVAELTPKVATTDLFINGYSRDPVFGMESFLFKETICGKRFNISCPAEANKIQYVYASEVVSANAPPAKFVMKMIVTGDSNQRLLCQTCNFEVR